MKKKLVKGVLMLSLAGTLALSGVAIPNTSLSTVIDAQAAKIVPKTTLAPAAGIAYDAKTKKISWNKVPGATRYKVELKDTAGNLVDYGYVYDALSIPFSYFYGATYGATYVVTVTAQNENEAYVVADKVSTGPWDTTLERYKDYDFYEKNTSTSLTTPITYSYYKYPSSESAPVTITIPADATQPSTTTITAISGIKVKEKGDTSITFAPTTEIALREGESIKWEFSNNDKFVSNKLKNAICLSGPISYNNDQTQKISYRSFVPGDTIYARARVYNSNYEGTGTGYSLYTPVIKVTVPQLKMDRIDVTSTTSSVSLTADTTAGAVTGYQFAKKVGSKWVTLGTQTDDTGPIR